MKTNGSSAKRLLAGVAPVALALGGAAFLVTKTDRAPTGDQPTASVNSPEVETRPAFALKDIHEAPQELRTRSFAFEAKADGFEAEGVAVKRDGELTFRSQASGDPLAQRLVSAAILDGRRVVEELARDGQAAPRADTGASKGTVRYDGFFAGLDLEYRYDGKGVEEFLHVDDALKERLIREKKGLRFTSLIPGVSRDSGAYVMPADKLFYFWSEDQGQLVPSALEDHSQILHSDNDVALRLQRDTLALAAAVAIDETGAKQRLWRRFDWTAEGLEVSVDVPSSWLAQAKGKVVIDPSIIDDTSSLQSRGSDQTRNMVRDSEGRLHVVFSKRFQDPTTLDVTWQAMYSSSADGTRWDRPTPIAELEPGIHTHYTPYLAIDSTNRLHALWVDRGSGDVGDRGRTGDTQRIRYAQCPNRCAGKTWAWQGQAGGRILFTTGLQWQGHGSMAVDQDDVVHIAFIEWTSVTTSGSNTTYARVVGDTLTRPGGLSYYRGTTSLVVDHNNEVHAFLPFNTNDSSTSNARVFHFVLHRPTGDWLSRASISTSQAVRGGWVSTGGGSHLGVKAAVDSNNDIHIAYAHHGYTTSSAPAVSGGNNRWRPFYARWDAISQTWQDVEYMGVNNNHIDWTSPDLTIDNNNRVHFFFESDNSAASSRIYYRTKDPGLVPSAASRIFVGSNQEEDPNLVPRLAFPVGFMDDVPPSRIQLNVRFNQNVLRFISQGQVVDSPVLLQPFDHRFIADSTPQFIWQRIPSDDGANTQYTLQISTTSDMQNLVYTIPTFTTPNYRLAASQSLPDGYYYWRVRAENATGQAFSKIFEVAVEAQGPPAPQLFQPAHNSDPGTKTPTFVWEDVSNR